MRSRINGFNFSARTTSFLFEGAGPFGNIMTGVPTKR